jgi:hypothetical protein
MHVLSACAIGIFAAGSALADGTQAAPTTSAGALSDMKVARDKETGALRSPNAEENAALGARSFLLSPNVVVQRRPFTTVEVRADGSAVAKRSLDDMDNLVLTRTPDGRNVLRHSEKPAPAAPTQSLPQE